MFFQVAAEMPVLNVCSIASKFSVIQLELQSALGLAKQHTAKYTRCTVGAVFNNDDNARSTIFTQ